ncbi:reverse transcriptase family protein [Romboutsia sp. 1001216sp1]|uniref:reverse transcriptase family protein n=1 Tax=Romboutsia sp. 1001216sp1 TaxID=2986997 RepID=UPI00232B7417|nr:reverse transcriptase family protein [Romboutsia sp. 1001216sp1]MDB8803593.1 reverse transcriptase family protein [Romboutsia sp. 1001216sp1]MDB8807905.1 reverse transcriptase family protein [Romboutsia sp. 1001216sp1]MDB8809241.1 reverse transcriptase family protein [Romboutsia sp. 1001216sp1]MDB8814989.1 reverse transcriptase family protein [Romboutsia sp. 1001216sp1]MDB8819722.1 reverse transcriptase family protein [Romboutsia sp. 1001216sp1]
MNKIKVVLNDKNIKYPNDYKKWINDDIFKSIVSKLEIDIIDFINVFNKYKLKLEKIIINKDRKGKILYIKGHPIKHYMRYGYNHYTTRIDNKEYTFIYIGEDFGAPIPKKELIKLINNIYINNKSLNFDDNMKYNLNLLKNGYEPKKDFTNDIYYCRYEEIEYSIINNIKLFNYLESEVEVSYKTFKIPKKRGGYRTIESPNKSLKDAQRLIVELILKSIEISSYSTAFIEGSTIKDNAKKHVNKKYVLNMDLKDFFNNIGKERVYNIFKSQNIPHREALKYTRICTYNGGIPQGASSSPYISNIVCINLDKRISSICNMIDADYTRYADDITISSNNKNIKRYIKSIENIIIEEGFEINYDKVRLLSNNTRQIVTGLVVNEKVGANKEYIKNIRQEIYYCKKYGVKEHLKYSNIDISEEEYINQLRGKIGFIKGINWKKGRKLFEMMEGL